MSHLLHRSILLESYLKFKYVRKTIILAFLWDKMGQITLMLHPLFGKRVGNYRLDKAAEDATTVEEIVEIYKSQLKKIAE